VTSSGIVPAHHQPVTLHVVASIPDHAPRPDDPFYHLFEQAKRRIKAAGMWRCVLDDAYCGGEPELHHTHVEQSQIEASDFRLVNQALGLHIKDEDEFRAWCEQPGNLEVLCTNHHRTHFGVHMIPQPLWEPMRYRKAGVEPPARFYSAAEWAALKAAGTRPA
jgi:hypothetical protein